MTAPIEFTFYRIDLDDIADATVDVFSVGVSPNGEGSSEPVERQTRLLTGTRNSPDAAVRICTPTPSPGSAVPRGVTLSYDPPPIVESRPAPLLAHGSAPACAIPPLVDDSLTSGQLARDGRLDPVTGRKDGHLLCANPHGQRAERPGGNDSGVLSAAGAPPDIDDLSTPRTITAEVEFVTTDYEQIELEYEWSLPW